MKKVGILNIGQGNFLSLASALNELNVHMCSVENYRDLKSVDALILPGVGAFNSYMQKINEAKLQKALVDYALYCEKPLLGICVGMHVLFTTGEENGVTDGLGIFSGKVIANNSGLNVGYNSLIADGLIGAQRTIGFTSKTEFYFTHGYHIETQEEFEFCYHSNVGSEKFLALLNHKNVFGCQFHPELSGSDGVKLLKDVFQC